ncbi:MAG: translation initiation factor IF-2 [Planctomycetes bacterium]|nr:translation initiation factor IF-2 [Planctomycetota bacterium]
MRLHELAKELDADSKRLLTIAKELGLGVKSHSSNLPKGTEGILRAAWLEEVAESAEAAPKPESSVAVTLTVGKTVDEEVPAAAPVDEPQAEPVQPEVAAEVPVEAEAEAEPVEAQTEVVEEAPVEPAEPVEETADAVDPVVSESVPEPPAAVPVETPHPTTVVVTFGGMPQPSDAEPPPGSEPEPGSAAAQLEESQRRESAGDEQGDSDGDDKEGVQARGIPNVPQSRERKGAKILGRIDLKPADVAPPTRSRNAPAYDPLDPTRAMPARPGREGEKKGAFESEHARKGRPGKGGGSDFVFDPEDNSTLSAIRLHGFQGRRRPPPRRPPARRSRGGGGRRAKRSIARPTHPITVTAPIGVRELSEELGIKAREILSYFPTFDPRDKSVVLNAEQLLELAVALEREINVSELETAGTRLMAAESARTARMAGASVPRPPVVAVMGHVDHGKTSLLDALRKSRLTSKEAGGITQKTSAYAVTTESGARVTMIDTPGHKAFTEMRARGASATDVAVLVVAADDGVMEQTQEAIDHAQAAGVPIVVAINKIDKNNADTAKVRQQLANVGILVEDYGGEVGVVECSATTGKGLQELVERLALETELLELDADPGIPARGVVIDSRRDSKLGIVATCIVQDGTLRAKDALLAGKTVGRARWLLDDRGGRITEAGPSTPVQVVGFEDPPEAGARFLCVEDLTQARLVAKERIEADKVERESPVDTVSMENLFDTIAAENVTEINVILKSDNMASMEVLRRTVEDVTHEEVRFRVIRTGVGDVTEDDVLLASASKAFIIGFGVDADTRARQSLQRTGVDFKPYKIIYEMTEDLEKALEGELGTEKVEEITGHAEIRAIFKSSKLGNIAGCYVTDGTIHRDSHVRVQRKGKVVHSGRLDSLKRFKDDVKEVREAYECGIHIRGFDEVELGDVVEAFSVTEVKRTLESTSSS